MKIKFSLHALTRMRERGLKENDVINAIKFPDRVENSTIIKNRFLIKKIYYLQKQEKDHLLMVICEKEGGGVKVITIIDTSKISKYF